MGFSDKLQKAYDQHVEMTYSKTRKWLPVLIIAVLMAVIAWALWFFMTGDIDMLSGKDAVKKYLIAGLIRFLVTAAAFVLLLVFFILTWKGKKNKKEHYIIVGGSCILMFVLAFYSFGAVIGASRDLKSARKIDVKAFTLYDENSGRHIIAFKNKDKKVTLEIPNSKADEILEKGTMDNSSSDEIFKEITKKNMSARFFINELKLEYYEYTNVFADAQIGPTTS